tara:strand:- start:69 stop:488 length:420 start_codon:yes stop_codon:yes gene_type:complete
MELKITIELNEEETKQLLTFVRSTIRGSPQVATKTETEPQAIEDSQPSGNLEPMGEELLEHHDCLENVEFDVIEDEDGIYTVVTCEICGNDVSEEYQEAYSDYDCEDDCDYDSDDDSGDDSDDDYFDAMRELFGGNGDD